MIDLMRNLTANAVAAGCDCNQAVLCPVGGGGKSLIFSKIRDFFVATGDRARSGISPVAFFVPAAHTLPCPRPAVQGCCFETQLRE